MPSHAAHDPVLAESAAVHTLTTQRGCALEPGHAPTDARPPNCLTERKSEEGKNLAKHLAYLLTSSVFVAEGGGGGPSPVSPAAVVLALLLPVQAALSFVRSLPSLAHLSILADACTVLAVAAVVKQDAQLLAARGGQPFAGRSAVAEPWGVAFACGFAVFCFEGFCMTLALEASMSDRSRFRSVLLQAIAGVTAVYVCFGACGYLAYGDATKDIITLNLPNNWSTAAVKVSQKKSSRC